MARISTYVIDGTIVDGDKVIGSDANNSMQTKNYTVGDLVNYFAASIGNDFLVPYIGANDDVNLGTFNLSAGGLSISQEIIANGTAGISGQILMSQGIGNPAVWGYPIGTQDLNSVLNIGNVGNKNINLINANGSALIDVEKTYSKIAIYLVDTISGSQTAWDTNNLHVENSSYLADYSSNKIRYTTGLYYVDIIPTNYSNQTFMLPYNGGYIPMSVNGVYADASGSITIPIGVGSVTNVTATAPLLSTGGTTPDISIPQASTLADGYLSSTDWNTFDGKQDPITLTTTGTSGAATFVANTLNIPQYSGGGTTPNLQQVTDVIPNGNITTNDIYVGNNITVGRGPYISVVPLYNTVLGVETLLSNDYGDGNVAIGFNALKSNVNGSNNVAVGRLAMFANIDGFANCALGDAALTSNTSGYANSAFGPYALVANTTGTSNIGFGTQALGSNTMGDQNVGIGRLAGYYNISGSQNIFIGYNAGVNMELGDGNTIIGSNQTSNGNESGYVIIGSATSTRIIFNDLGQGKFPSYGAGSYTAGTVTYVLGVDASGNIIETTAGGTTPDLQQVTDAGRVTTNDIEVSYLQTNGDVFVGKLGAGGAVEIDDGGGFVGRIDAVNLTTYNLLHLPDATGTFAMSVNGVAAIEDGSITVAVPTKTSELFNDGDNGYTHFISLQDLPSNLTLYATNVASGISTYTKAVSSLTDPDFNTVAVDIPVGPLTSTTVATYCGGIISAANIIVGNPGIFTMSTIGNIRRTSGTAEGVFFYEVYKRDSGGTETLIVTSANTFPVSSPTYVEFNAAALFNNGVFTATDRIVIKFYGLRLPGGSDPFFQFQFGGTAPVRTTLPIPLAVTPLPREIISISTNTAAGYSNGVDYIYLVSGATTLTLPTAVGNVGEYTVKRVGAGVVSIATTSSQTIDGSASPITINVQYVSLTLVSDGANWNII